MGKRLPLLLISATLAAALALPGLAQEDDARGFKPKPTTLTFKLDGSRSAWKAEPNEAAWAKLETEAKVDLALKRKVLVLHVLPGKQVSRTAIDKALKATHKSLRIVDAMLLGTVEVKLAEQPKWLKALSLWRALKNVKTIQSIDRPKRRASQSMRMVIVSPGLAQSALYKMLSKSLGLRNQRKDAIAEVVWHGPKQKGERENKGSGRKKRGSGGE